LRSPINNANRDAKRDRGRDALPGDPDFNEVVRAAKVGLVLLIVLPLLPPDPCCASQVRRRNDAKTDDVRKYARLSSDGDSTDDSWEDARDKEASRTAASVAL
jgi:hypothetical protein